MQRQDYVLRLIDQLGAFLRQVWILRKGGQPDEAIMAVVRAQENLMSAFASEFSQWDVERQFERLIDGEEPVRACDKVFAYALLMDAAAEAYRDKDLEALAEGAGMLAEQIRSLARQKFPAEAVEAEARVSKARPA
jgi:hypothetical protein